MRLGSAALFCLVFIGIGYFGRQFSERREAEFAWDQEKQPAVSISLRGEPFSGKVLRVSDSDTITVLQSGQPEG